MTGGDEQPLSRALHAVVADPVVPPDLADTARRRYTRRRILAGGALAGVLAGGGVAAGLGLGVAGPTGGRSPNDAVLRHAIRAGRFVRAVAFDDGALTIAPPSRSTPSLGEREAISILRSTGMPSQAIAEVRIGYGTVHLRDDLRDESGLRPGAAVWVMVYRTGEYHCPGSSDGSSDAPGRVVLLLDASEGMVADLYQESAVTCGVAHDASLGAAYQYASLPWQPVRRSGTQLVVRYHNTLGCATEPSTMTSSNARAVEVTVLGSRPMRVLRCPAPQDATVTVPLNVSASLPVTHAPTGRVTALYTRLTPPTFEFYDG